MKTPIQYENALTFFIQKGFKLLPCYNKEEATPDHPFKSPKVKRFTDPTYKGLSLKQAVDNFVGLAIPEGYQILDLDKHGDINGVAEGKKVLEEAGIKYNGIINTTTTGGKHLFFKIPDDNYYTKCGKASPRKGIDGRKIGNYVCAYTFSGSLQIQELTKEQWRELRSILDGCKSTKEKLFGEYTGFEGAKDLKCFELWSEGEKLKDGDGRNSYLTSFAGHLRATEEIDIGELLDRVNEENKRACDPELPYKEICSICKSVFKYKEKEEIKKNKNKETEKDDKIKKYPLTDIGSAEWLRDELSNNYLWCPDQRDWYHWCKNIWKRDNSMKYGAAAIEKIKTWFEKEKEKYNVQGKEVLKKYITGIKKSYPRIQRIIHTMQNYISVSPDEFDANDDLLNFENGVLNLTTGDFRDHRREDYQTKKALCNYDPDKKPSELWLRFLHDTFLGDEELIDYIQKIMGFALCGKIGRQEFYMLWGEGENGKSQLIGVYQDIFGEYTYSIGADKIMESRYANNDTYFAQLKNVRALFCSESREGAHLNVALIKNLTEEQAKFNVAQKFERAQQFKLKCSVFLTTNHKPIIRDTSVGAWRRIKLIPFLYRVPEDKKILRFADKLLESGKEGICNWFIEGYYKAISEGIKEPEQVKLSITQYQKEQDDIENFLTEYCDFGEGYKVRSLDLLQTYDRWNGRKTHSNVFTPKIIARGYKQIVGEDRRIYFIGIRLKNNDKEESFT